MKRDEFNSRKGRLKLVLKTTAWSADFKVTESVALDILRPVISLTCWRTHYDAQDTRQKPMECHNFLQMKARRSEQYQSDYDMNLEVKKVFSPTLYRHLSLSGPNAEPRLCVYRYCPVVDLLAWLESLQVLCTCMSFQSTFRSHDEVTWMTAEKLIITCKFFNNKINVGHLPPSTADWSEKRVNNLPMYTDPKFVKLHLTVWLRPGTAWTNILHKATCKARPKSGKPKYDTIGLETG